MTGIGGRTARNDELAHGGERGSGRPGVAVRRGRGCSCRSPVDWGCGLLAGLGECVDGGLSVCGIDPGVDGGGVGAFVSHEFLGGSDVFTSEFCDLACSQSGVRGERENGCGEWVGQLDRH